MTYVVCLGVQYLTGFAGSDRWTTNPMLAFGFTDQDAAQRAADRINGLKLGNTKATVEIKGESQRAATRRTTGHVARRTA